MTSFTISTEVTGPQTLDVNEVGFVTPNGTLFGAVNMTEFAFLIVTGSVFSAQAAVSSLDAAFVTVGVTGVLSGSIFGIEISGESIASTVNNRGIIYGSTGIFNVGSPLTVVNSGTITGDGAIAILSNDGIRVSNSGEIDGASEGIKTTGTEATFIVNSGLIFGGFAALSLSNGDSRVTNTGVLQGNSLLGGGQDFLDGTTGTQGAVFGGAGRDTLLGGVGADGLFGGTEIDVLRGGGSFDRLAGGAANDTLWGNDGDDTMSGDANADALYGGDGDDVLGGGTEADRLFGGAGDDVLSGGTGVFADTLRGGLGDDTLTGGGGADSFAFFNNQGTDRITDFVNDVDKLDLRAFDFANLAAVVALASASSLGLRIDLPGDGVLFVGGLTLAQLNAADVLV